MRPFAEQSPIALSPRAKARARNGSSSDAPLPPPISYGPADYVRAWSGEQKLPRLATGFRTLDDACRGGLAVPWRVVIVGAPHAGKTFIATVIARVLMRREDVFVGMLCVDEEPEDVQLRLAQMAGYSIADCEDRDARVLERMAGDLEALPLRLYGPEWTIEAAAADLARRAPAKAHRVFTIDSVQTVTSDAGAHAEGPRELIEANVRAVRHVTTTHRLLSITTSEANRGQYANAMVAAAANRMASGAESRAIEFAAQTLIYVGTPKKHPNVVHAEVPKNRRGGRGSFEFWLSLDREKHELREVPNPDGHEELSDAEALARGERVQSEAAKFITLVIGRNPGCGTKRLRQAVKATGRTMGNDAIDAAVGVALKLDLVVDHVTRRGHAAPDHHYYAAGVTAPAGCPCDVCAGQRLESSAAETAQ